jgi:hypothetical protein
MAQARPQTHGGVVLMHLICHYHVEKVKGDVVGEPAAFVSY